MSELRTPAAPAATVFPLSQPLQYLPATGTRQFAEPLVLLHGWGGDSRSWQALLPHLRPTLDLILVELPGTAGHPAASDPDTFIEQLLAQLPERFLLLGWSLGGMLAVKLAACRPRRVLGLMTLASNARFVAAEDWPAAMPAAEFRTFCEGFAGAPEATLQRFAGLMARGDSQQRPLVRQLRTLAADSWLAAAEGDWQATLYWLAELDNRRAWASLTQPGLHLLGEGDALVPASAGAWLGQLNPRQRVEVVAAAGHALHQSQPQRVAGRLLNFVEQVHYAVDKRRVADSFGRAAQHYDSVAALQRRIGEKLLAMAPAASDPPESVWLDLGCGTGHFSPALAAGGQRVLGLDLAQGMLEYAARTRQAPVAGGQLQWLCGDAEALPLADSCVDGVFSSLAIQWCADLPQLFAELGRVLKPGGRALIATLGPRTLHELRSAWRQVDNYTHVNRFATAEQLRTAIAGSGLRLQHWQSEDIVLRYQQLRQLTFELKTLGAHNMTPGQSSGLTGRQRLRRLCQAYDELRLDDGQLPATYEVFYLQLSR